MMDLAVGTISLVRKPGEAEVLYEALRSLCGHGLPVTVADGGSGAEFVRRIESLPNLRLAPPVATRGPRLVGQVQAAFTEVLGTDARYVLYTEPDKQWFFERRLAGFLEALRQHPEAGVLVAARDAGSFATFPAGQQLSERLTNELCAEVLGLPGDFLYGPLLLRREVLPPLLEVEENIGWGWRLYAMVVSLRLGHPVVCWEADLPCPVEQRGEDDPASRIYRMDQMAQNVRGVALALKS